MKVIGLTGGVGAGKTQILEYLNQKYGASTCSADEVARKLQKKGGACYGPIVEYLGAGILDEKEELDRKKLADIVFADPEKRRAVSGIVHPAVEEAINRKIQKEERKNTNLFVLESAILIECGYGKACDEVWYIYVEDEVRKNRLQYSRGYDARKIEEIIAAQLPKEEFLKHCDRVIENSNVFAETMLQIDKIVKGL